MNVKLSMEWTSHVKDDKQREDLENAIRNSTAALGRLYDMLRQIDNGITAQEVTDDYLSPAWGYKQADLNGQRKILRRLLNLLQFVKGPKNV